MNLVKRLLYFFFSLQEKQLTKNLSKTIGVKNSSKRKQYYMHGCTLTLDSIAETEKEKMEEEILLILKSCNFDPKETLKYIQKHGTNVYYINNANALHSIGENEGFVYPQKGALALYLSLLTTKKISLKTNEMFILSEGEINQYYFIYHFYNWYAFKHNIAGLDYESQNLLKKYLYDENADFKTLQLSDIYKLKDAIKQDKASIAFVFKLYQRYAGAKEALQKLQDKGTSI